MLLLLSVCFVGVPVSNKRYRNRYNGKDMRKYRSVSCNNVVSGI